MPASITFTEFTDEEVFLEDREAANAFFNGIRVPDATTADPGVVKKAAAIAALDALATNTVTSLRDDGSQEVLEVVSKEDGDLIRAKINAIIAALQAAGVMS
jgi:hypothetical protein